MQGEQKAQPGVRMLFYGTRLMNGEAASRAQLDGLLLATLSNIICERDTGRGGVCVLSWATLVDLAKISCVKYDAGRDVVGPR